MTGRVIQGYFIGGAMRPQPAPRAAATEARPRHSTGAPPPAFAGRTAPLQARMAPGRPPLAHQGAGRAAQPHGGNGSFEIDPVQLGLARGGGKPLPQALLTKMEAAFAADFSAVRVHVGPQASRIGALAFTTGNDLYFAPGQFQPDNIKGHQLIGHELAHVIQQRQGRARMAGGGMAVVQDRALEAEADRLGMLAAIHRTPVQARQAVAQRRTAAPAAPPRDLRASSPARGVDAARARGRSPTGIAQRSSSSNYAFAGNVVNHWQSSYDTGYSGLNEAIASYGMPTQHIIKEYMDLGDRIRFERSSTSFSSMLQTDILSMLRSNDALNFGKNPFLEETWSDNLSNYSGRKSGASLYGPMRSMLTGELKGYEVSGEKVNEYLKQISGRPAEVHHIIYKSIFGAQAVNIYNLMLVNRSASESRDGFSQHELMHYVSSGGDKDKFKVLDDKFVKIFVAERNIN